MSSATSTAGNTIGVLICDDVEAMRLLLRVLIELSPGLHVAGEARDGDEAISEAERVRPDVILLDLSMPRRTGLDALPDLRAVAPEAGIIAFSGLDGSIVKEAALQAGASHFLQKGADPNAIVAAIEDAAANGRVA
jgi:DNA-binding NarL/FixJ family response regulator